MTKLSKKIAHCLFTLLLVPAISCLCCHTSHAESSNSCCCHEESEHDGNSEKEDYTKCCSDCFFQSSHKERHAIIPKQLIENESSKNDSSSKTLPPDSKYYINLSKYSNWEFTFQILTSNFSENYFYFKNIKSSPIQGRSPPLLS